METHIPEVEDCIIAVGNPYEYGGAPTLYHAVIPVYLQHHFSENRLFIKALWDVADVLDITSDYDRNIYSEDIVKKRLKFRRLAHGEVIYGKLFYLTDE